MYSFVLTDTQITNCKRLVNCLYKNSRVSEFYRFEMCVRSPALQIIKYRVKNSFISNNILFYFLKFGTKKTKTKTVEFNVQWEKYCKFNSANVEIESVPEYVIRITIIVWNTRVTLISLNILMWQIFFFFFCNIGFFKQMLRSEKMFNGSLACVAIYSGSSKETLYFHYKKNHWPTYNRII